MDEPNPSPGSCRGRAGAGRWSQSPPALPWSQARPEPPFEAGAQGPHKLARGYLPTHTYSLHWIADRGFRKAVADYLRHELRYVDQEKAAIEAHSPFRAADADDARPSALEPD